MHRRITAPSMLCLACLILLPATVRAEREEAQSAHRADAIYLGSGPAGQFLPSFDFGARPLQHFLVSAEDVTGDGLSVRTKGKRPVLKLVSMALPRGRKVGAAAGQIGHLNYRARDGVRFNLERFKASAGKAAPGPRLERLLNKNPRIVLFARALLEGNKVKLPGKSAVQRARALLASGRLKVLEAAWFYNAVQATAELKQLAGRSDLARACYLLHLLQAGKLADAAAQLKQHGPGLARGLARLHNARRSHNRYQYQYQLVASSGPVKSSPGPQMITSDNWQTRKLDLARLLQLELALRGKRFAEARALVREIHKRDALAGDAMRAQATPVAPTPLSPLHLLPFPAHHARQAARFHRAWVEHRAEQHPNFKLAVGNGLISFADGWKGLLKEFDGDRVERSYAMDDMFSLAIAHGKLAPAERFAVKVARGLGRKYRTVDRLRLLRWTCQLAAAAGDRKRLKKRTAKLLARAGKRGQDGARDADLVHLLRALMAQRGSRQAEAEQALKKISSATGKAYRACLAKADAAKPEQTAACIGSHHRTRLPLLAKTPGFAGMLSKKLP